MVKQVRSSLVWSVGLCYFCFGFCSALVLHTPNILTSLHFLFLFLSPALFPVFLLLLLLLSHSRSQRASVCLCVCVGVCMCVRVRVFRSQRHCTLPTLCKNGALVCALVCFLHCELNSCGCFTYTMMSHWRGGKVKQTEGVFWWNTYRKKCEYIKVVQLWKASWNPAPRRLQGYKFAHAHAQIDRVTAAFGLAASALSAQPSKRGFLFKSENRKQSLFTTILRVGGG